MVVLSESEWRMVSRTSVSSMSYVVVATWWTNLSQLEPNILSLLVSMVVDLEVIFVCFVKICPNWTFVFVNL